MLNIPLKSLRTEGILPTGVVPRMHLPAFKIVLEISGLIHS